MKLDNLKINELNLELDKLESQVQTCDRIRNEIRMECERAIGSRAYNESAVMYNIVVLKKLIKQLEENVNMSRDMLESIKVAYDDINDKMRD